MDKIELAKSFAYIYHRDQKYGEEPYYNHLWRVFDAVKKAGYGEDYQIVALLHDSVEDTSMSYETIERNFGVEIAGDIASITHIEREKYFDYIRESVMHNEVAKVVKFFDLMDNLEHGFLNEKYASLIPRYKKALQIMTLGDVKWEDK
jgi:(p)ppGpp synthase/HD superfamily hydrolase